MSLPSTWNLQCGLNNSDGVSIYTYMCVHIFIVVCVFGIFLSFFPEFLFAIWLQIIPHSVFFLHFVKPFAIIAFDVYITVFKGMSFVLQTEFRAVYYLQCNAQTSQAALQASGTTQESQLRRTGLSSPSERRAALLLKTAASTLKTG